MLNQIEKPDLGNVVKEHSFSNFYGSSLRSDWVLFSECECVWIVNQYVMYQSISHFNLDTSVSSFSI